MKLATGITLGIAPACLVAIGIALVAPASDSFTGFFVVAAFVSTVLGCSAAVVALRRRAKGLSLTRLLGIVVGTTALLLAAFTTMPRWPFTDVGFVFAWVALSAGLTLVLLYTLSRDA